MIPWTIVLDPRSPLPHTFLGQISPNATCQYNILVQFLKVKRILKQNKMFDSS